MRVTVQQAACNAFATWLGSNVLDTVVEPRWPAPDKKKPPKSITLITAGRRQDEAVDLKLVKNTNLNTAQTTAIWQVAACTQPMQLDIWALTDIDRDDLMARLDDLFHSGESSLTGAVNPMPVGTAGNLVALGDGWESCGTIADFVFQSPDVEMTSDVTGRGLYRATYRGNAYVMLTATTVTARQLAINFALQLSDTDTPIAFP